MNTKISTIYLNKITELAKEYALKRMMSYSKKTRKKVFNSSFEVYYNISIFFYLRLNKISKNKINFNYNRIQSTLLKKFSCKLYKEICNDLESNEIIVINNHYLNNRKNGFSKSFLIHKNIINKINESKTKFKYELSNIEVPEKILKISGYSSVSNSDDNFLTLSKLNRFYRNNQLKKEYIYGNNYRFLEYDENSLNDYCKDDEFLYNFYKKSLNRLKKDPKFVKGRWYHVFHEFSKDFREKVLRFKGSKIKEIFDVSGSDLHMLCKVLENLNIPNDELIKFEYDVKNDFRKKFGIRKYDGKCKEYVKKAFKVYLNGHYDMYSYFRKNSICRKIDDYFKDNYPSIRNYIVNHDKIWFDTMNEEFDVISIKMFESLKNKGIDSLTCHDAIYINENERIENVNKLFYDSLDLMIDRIDKLNEL